MDPKLITILTLTLALLTSSSTSTLLSELQTLRSRSDSGVIHLTDESITRFVLNSPTPRAYSLFVFFDATQLRNKPELHLPHLRSEFALVSNSASGSDDIFFCDIEFGESSHSFQLFGVNSLPHIRYISATVRSLKDSEPMDQSGFAEGAESMARFVENKGRVSVGPIERPPPISKKQIGFLLLALLVSAPYLIKRVLAGETLVHDWRLWMFMAIFVYFFSVGGNMHNIIRKMPMVLQDRNNENIKSLMSLLDHLWDDTVAGPRPSGLSKLRRSIAAAGGVQLPRSLSYFSGSGSEPSSPATVPGTPKTPTTPGEGWNKLRRKVAGSGLEAAEPRSPTVYDWVVISSLDR